MKAHAFILHEAGNTGGAQLPWVDTRRFAYSSLRV